MELFFISFQRSFKKTYLVISNHNHYKGNWKQTVTSAQNIEEYKSCDRR